MEYTILIVDDFKISNEIVSDSLIKQGYQTVTCQKASEAIKLLQTVKVDAIITDYLMPEMDGLEFLMVLRNIPEYKTTPVIFLSSTKDSKIINTAYKYNISAWFNKPLDIKKLIKVLNNILK